MNVDIDNFSQIRQLILQQEIIQKSEIISFDLEFAGLKFQGNDRDRSQYMPGQKYQKMSQVARKYCIMQVGITFFIPSKNSQFLTAHPFNFYVFPRPTIYNDPVISMQSACVSFNITHKMDWTRWIEKGITYMKLTQYERITQILQKARKFDQLLEFLQQENKLIVKQIIQQISLQQKSGKLSKTKQSKIYQIPNSSFMFIKKVIQKYFQQHQKLYAIKTILQQFIQIQIRLNHRVQIVKITREEKDSIENKELQEIYGFTLLFEKIWNSGKTLVGHNCFFDILFLYDAFIGALPYDYQLFKKAVTEVKNSNAIGGAEKMEVQNQQQVKRKFYDTKFISNNLNFQFQYFEDGTTLQSIYHTLKANNLATKKIVLPKQYSNYDLQNKILHQAGFDSYLTGWIYYQMIQLCKKDKINLNQKYKSQINFNRSYFYSNLNEFHDGICQYIRVFYIEVIQPKKYVTIDKIKKQRAQALKAIRDVIKQENIAKDVITHEGLKEVFIQIKETMKDKKIKNVYGLSHYLQARNAKQWMDTLNKNGANVPSV